jgi:hypothetical protein
MLVRRARIVAFLIFGVSGGTDASQEGKDIKLEDMKLEDMKLEDMKLEDMKLEDMKLEDMKLEDMGFVIRAADTPAQIERLRLLLPRMLSAGTYPVSESEKQA